MKTLDYPPEALSSDRLLPILSVAAMQAADRYAIDELAIPGFALMDVAGRAVFRAISARLQPEDTVTVFCGPGNNGGDGYVVARLLVQAGHRVRVVRTKAPAEGSDASRHAALLDRLHAHGFSDRFSIISAEAFLSSSASERVDWCVDALLGTGVNREVAGTVGDLIDWINASGRPVVSVDVPSGLNGDTGETLGRCVHATQTVTLASLKTGLVMGEGPAACGDVVVAEIGIPSDVLRSSAEADGGAMAVTDEAVRAWIPPRSRDAYKYSAGFVLVIAGSRGMAGAAIMTARAAARMGAGYVACAVPDAITTEVTCGVPTSTSMELPTKDGGILALEAIETIGTALERADAVVIGPGLGRHSSTMEFVRRLLARWNSNTVVDADAIVALADVDLTAFEHRDRWLLTPHSGEFGHLTGTTPTADGRLQIAATFARENGTTLLLKGTPSIVGRRTGLPFVATTGHESLATAGTGDVLSGMCGALLARGLEPDRAAAAALHLGGLTAREFSRSAHGSAMIATDLIDRLPHSLFDRLTTP
jgi:ADP-dependent NAD(P)H-hydrate dehydratase / NAD(P)H-hydrate epimerase